MQLSSEIAWCTFGIFVSIFLRLCTTLHPYSGQSRPPMFGDYEAQRHWMEITVNLPMNQWYHNTSTNDLNYWGLDYPPLTAYHSYINGLVAWLLDPDFVALGQSRGFESAPHKLFMRYTVLLADLLVYIPSVVVFYMVSTPNTIPPRAALTLALLYPGLILIDHGHFQYNCISLGFAVLAAAALCAHRDIVGSVLFVLAVNYKQMELYHAFPFFLYLLSSCIPQPGASALSGIFKLFKLALVVVATFGVLWLPFLLRPTDALQVLHRLFPVARGVFEDKVANIWCALNVVYKLKDVCPTTMLRYCTLATLAALLPSSANLFLSPNSKKLLPALINSSLAFFLFSFQVHEKSILLAAIPVVLILPEHPVISYWFLHISTFSMLPLLVKDKLVVAYLALMVFYSAAFAYCHDRWGTGGRTKAALKRFLTEVKKVVAEPPDVLRVAYKHLIQDGDTLKELVQYALMGVSLVGCGLLTTLLLVFDPPKQYPDLFTLMVCVYSCLHFVAFFLYFNVVQFRIPQCFEAGVRCARRKLKQT